MSLHKLPFYREYSFQHCQLEHTYIQFNIHTHTQTYSLWGFFPDFPARLKGSLLYCPHGVWVCHRALLITWQLCTHFCSSPSRLCSVYKAKDLFLDYLYRPRKEGRRGEGRDSHILVLNKCRPLIHLLSYSPERLQSRSFKTQLTFWPPCLGLKLFLCVSTTPCAYSNPYLNHITS